MERHSLPSSTSSDDNENNSNKSNSLLEAMRTLPVRFEIFLKRLFYSYGELVADQTWLFIMIPLFCILVPMVGLHGINLSLDIRAEFSPLGSQSDSEYQVAREFFEGRSEPFWLAVLIQAKDGGSLMRRQYLQRIKKLKDYLQYEKVITVRGQNYTYQDFCGYHCIDLEPVNKFINLYLLNSTKFDYKYPASSLIFRGKPKAAPIYIANNFYQVETDPDTSKLTDFGLLYIAFRASLRNNLEKEITKKWYAEAYEANFRQNQNDILSITYTSHDMISKEISRSHRQQRPANVFLILSLTVFSLVTTLDLTGLVRCKFLEAISIVFIPLLAIGGGFGLLVMLNVKYTLVASVAFFVTIAIGVDDGFLMMHAWQQSNPQHSVRQRTAQMMCHVGPSITITSLTNILAFGIGIGANTVSVKTFSIYACTAASFDFFLQITLFAAIMALGGRREAQNRYPLVPCLLLKPDNTMEQQLSKGVNVHGKLAGLKQGVRSAFRSYSNQLTKWPARVFVIALLVTYWSFALYGVFNIQIALSEDKMMMDDSPLKEVMRINHDVITSESAILILFVNRPGDLRDLDRLNALETMMEEFEQLDEHIGPLSSRNFLRPFRDYLQMENEVKWRNETIFCYYQLQDFLNLGNNYLWRSYLRLNEEYCSDGAPYLRNEAADYNTVHRRKRQSTIHGDDVDVNNSDDDDDEDYYKMDDEYYNDDDGSLVEPTASLSNTKVSNRRFTCAGANPKCLDRLYFITSFRAADWEARSQLLLKWRAIANRYAHLNVTVYDEMGHYSDQYLSIGAMSLQTILIAMACMALICLIFIPHYVAAGFAMASILSINLGVFGFLSLWGVDLDPVSVALTLMSIGFSVDYTSHICYHFFRKPDKKAHNSSTKIHPETTKHLNRVGKSGKGRGIDAIGAGSTATSSCTEEQEEREERLWRAFDGVGWPTAQAGLSTLIGGLCMMWNASYTFFVFVKTLLLVVGFGLAHALLIMPVVLSSLPVHQTT